MKSCFANGADQNGERVLVGLESVEAYAASFSLAEGSCRQRWWLSGAVIPTEGFESAVMEELKPVAKRAGGVAHLPTRLNRTSRSCSLAVAETALLDYETNNKP